MSDIFFETRFEHGLKLIRSGILILLVYLVANSLTEITALFSEVEKKDNYLKSESTSQADTTPICDIQSRDYDSEACYLESLDSKINSQLISTIWSFIPLTGIVLIFVGMLRLMPDEYEENEQNPRSAMTSDSKDLQDNQYLTLSNRVLTLEGEVKAHNEKLTSPKFYELLYGAR